MSVMKVWACRRQMRAVALSVASPRSFLTVGFPLQSLTRNAASRSTLLVVLISLANGAVIGQSTERKPTIPLNEPVRISIASVHTTFSDSYTVYQAEYKGDSIVAFGFWTRREEVRLELGLATVTLCRVIQMKEVRTDGTVIGHRGCAFYNGLYVYTDSTLVRRFNFNECAASPFLRLCSTDVGK